MDSILGKGWFIASFLFVVTSSLYGQRDYKGTVIDAKTGEPIPYVNIGIVEKRIGTVSDEEGLFHLYLKETNVESTAMVLFSALGYASLNIPLIEMPSQYNEYPIFKMTPKTLELNEVVVSNKNGTFISDVIGYKSFGTQSFGYWKDNIALGGELATKINAKNGLRRLEKFQFEVFDNPSDSVLLRVNIYDDDGPLGRPKTKLNTSGDNILVTVKKTDKIVWVELKPFDIYVQNDFIVSLELLKVYGNKKLGLILAATLNDQYGSYRKYASQDKWERFTDQNMAYYLETQLMVSEKVAQRFEKKKKHKKKKERTISGFTIIRGKMIAGVEITNNRTNKTVLTDDNGRYTIAAKKNDRVFFRKKGYLEIVLTVGDKSTANVIMKTKPIKSSIPPN